MSKKIRKVGKWPVIHDMTGIPRPSIDRLEKAGNFPKRIQLSANSVGWYLDEVQDWLDSRPRGFLPETPAATEGTRKRHARQREAVQAATVS